MEIRIADNWKWITIDGNGSKWTWEAKPDYYVRDDTWEQGGKGGCFFQISTKAFSIDLGDDIKDAKDKIWRRNGDYWEYAGGQMTKDQARDEFGNNMREVLSYLGLGLDVYTYDTNDFGYLNGLTLHCYTKSSERGAMGEVYIALANFCKLIKDAEGGKDAN